MNSDYGSMSSLSSLSSLQNQSTVEVILKNFFRNNELTDVVFRVQCGSGYVRIPCHKLVLSMRSPVFADKFFGANKTIEKEIEVSEIPPSAFETMIKYCYGLNEDLIQNRGDINYLFKVFKAATIYEIDALRISCYNMFNATAPTVNNVFELLEASIITGSASLKFKCYNLLQQRTSEVLSLHDVFSVTPTVINTILDMPTVSLNSEYDLLNWLFEWGSYMCAKNKDTTFQTVMEPYLSRVNFTSLNPVEFGMLVKKYRKFFSKEEAFAIFMNIVCPDCGEDLPTWCNNTTANRSFSE